MSRLAQRRRKVGFWAARTSPSGDGSAIILDSPTPTFHGGLARLNQKKYINLGIGRFLCLLFT